MACGHPQTIQGKIFYGGEKEKVRFHIGGIF